jgi:hypothetical protein
VQHGHARRGLLVVRAVVVPDLRDDEVLTDQPVLVHELFDEVHRYEQQSVVDRRVEFLKRE